MFYEQHEIIKELVCPRCHQMFVDPRILPCGETICIYCIHELTSTINILDCFFCKEKHKASDDKTGFIQNKFMNQIMSKKPRFIYQGKTIEEFRKSLEKLMKITNHLESNMKNSETTVIEHCDKVRNQIDLCAEEKLYEINSIRDEYISKINDYQKECLDNIEKNLKIFQDLTNESKLYVKECENFLIDESVNDQLVKEKHCKTERLYNQIYTKQIFFDSIKFNGSLLGFESNELTGIFGQLKSTPLISYEQLIFDGELCQTLNGHSGGVNVLEWIDENRIASGSDDKSIKIWVIQSGECVKTIPNAHEYWICGLKMLDNNTLASSSQENSIKIWNIESGELIKTLEGHTNTVRCLLKLNVDHLISCSQDSTIKIWNLDNCQAIKTLIGHSYGVYCIVSLNNRTIASGSSDKTIIIWDIVTDQILRKINAHSDIIWSLILLPNGNLASCSRDKTIKIWNVETGEILRILTGHADQVFCLALLKNGNIASGSHDKTIRIWNPNSDKSLIIIDAHTEYVNSLIVMNNGHLISSSTDNKIKIWK